MHPIEPYLQPKPAGGFRLMARLSDRDAVEWRAIAGRVGRAVERRLSPRVLANRASVPVGPALRRARSAARNLGASADVVLRTDVRSFYAAVTPSVTFRSLIELNVDARVASRTATMLDGWGSEGYAGLPIGPPGSAIIANAILAPLDTQLRSLSFLRWVDDYLIAVREREVDRVIERIDESLARVGLARSVPKTEVLAGGTCLRWLGTYGFR